MTHDVVGGAGANVASNVDDSAFTARRAIETLTEASGFEEGLRRRTEGVTWMIWGLVVAGIFTSYGLAGAAFEDFPPYLYHLWAPWVAAGVAITAALWRSAALAVRAEAPGGAARGFRISLLYTAFWVGVMLTSWLAYGLLDQLLNESGYMLFVLGLVNVGLGVTNVTRYTPPGRVVSLAVGVVLVAIAFASGALALGHGATTALAAVAGGGAYLVGGLVETLRG